MFHDVANITFPMVSEKEKDYTVCLALEHCLYIRLPLYSRLGLLLCFDLP